MSTRTTALRVASAVGMTVAALSQVPNTSSANSSAQPDVRSPKPSLSFRADLDAATTLETDTSGNTAPSTPTLVSPASGATLSAGTPQLFIIQAADSDGDPYAGWVTVFDAVSGQPVAVFETSPAASGEQSAGVPQLPLPSGNYTWTASASDLPYGHSSPQATAQAFVVTGPPDGGGGVFTGQVSYSPALPQVGQPCAPISFSVSLASVASMVSVAPTLYSGSITFSGSGNSACESATSGSGTLSLSAQGTGAAGTTISCQGLEGQYSRVGSQLTAVLDGLCTLNGFVTSAAAFDVESVIVPDGSVTGPFGSGSIDGAFAVLPAS
ncbi:MAG: hypothetical protein ACYCO3_10470 [Mycobacteriales bacterium]